MIDRARQSGHRDNRAVSDVLAFILVFSIIITSVGLVYVFGMGALGDAQVSEQNRNAERAFETLSVSFNDLQTGRGQERMSQLNPRGGQIRVDDSLTVEVTENSVGGGTLKKSDASSLEYSHEGTTISYELGAVFRADDGNSVMVRQPEFVCSSGDAGERAVMSYPDLAASQPSSITTSSTLRVRATAEEEDDVIRSDEDVKIKIEDSAHADAWKRYFEDGNWDEVEGETNVDAGRVTATCDSGSTTVRETGVDVALLTG